MQAYKSHTVLTSWTRISLTRHILWLGTIMIDNHMISCTVLCKILQKYMKIAITLNSNNSISIDFNFLTILLRDSRGEFTASGTGKQRLESGEDNVGEWEEKTGEQLGGGKGGITCVIVFLLSYDPFDNDIPWQKTRRQIIDQKVILFSYNHDRDQILSNKNAMFRVI